MISMDTYSKALIEIAASQERERIINLLEADCKDGLGDNIQGCSHEVAIALIKGEGENK